MSYPNVMLTPHQAFATKEALSNIAETTFYNIDCWAQNKKSDNELDDKQEENTGYVPMPWGKFKIKKIVHRVSV